MKNILKEELHRIQYLFGHKRGVVISEQEEIRQGAKGDPFQYKREGAPGGDYPETKYYYAKKGNDPSWKEQTIDRGWKAIKTEIFDNPSLAPTGAATPSANKNITPEIATATGINVQTTYDQLSTGKEKMNGNTFNTFGYFVKQIPGTDPNLPKTGKIDGVASTLNTEDFKAKYTDYLSYTYVPTPQGGFKPGIDVESNAVYGKETQIEIGRAHV